MFSFLIKAFNREKRLAELEATVEKLVSARRTQELEWESTYEKFRLLYVRLSKRVRQAEQAPEREDPQPGESGGTGELGQPTLLSPRQMEVNARILMRRRKAG